MIGILKEITDDWDVGEISAESQLGALNLESINFVYFIAELQQKYRLQQQLLARIGSTDGPVADLRIADVVDFVQEIRSARQVQREEASS